MTIYVITAGEYSDYSIYGVAVDKEIAKQIADRVSKYYEDANIAFKERMKFAEERLAHEFIKAIIPYMDISHETHGTFERFTAELQIADPFKRKF